MLHTQTSAVSLLDLQPEPWANGLGSTRTIATSPHSASAPWSWRLSLATLSADADFSPLPDVARIFTLASAGPIKLILNGNAHELSLGMQAQFMGTDQVAVTVDGATHYALNLMVRRGQGYGSVKVHRSQGAQLLMVSDLWQRTIVLDGTVRLPDGTECGPLSMLNHTEADLPIEAHNALLAHVIVTPTEQ